MRLFDKCVESIDLWFEAFNNFGVTGNKRYEDLMQTYAIKVDNRMQEIEGAGLSDMFYNQISDKYKKNNVDFIRGKTVRIE